MQSMCSGLQLEDTFISFPYINPNNSDIDRLLVDIEEKKSNTTVSLKHPQYYNYIKQHKTNILYNDICNYFETVIRMSNQNDNYGSSLTTILDNHGYSKDKDFTQTLQGEIFIAVNNYNIKEPVAIKKMYNQNIIISEEKMKLVRKALMQRNLQRRNSLVSDSIVNYIDLFQWRSDFYLVAELNFSVTLKEFILQSHEYIRQKRLKIKKYRRTIKYLLWRLILIIHYLRTDTNMNCSDLDICVENIMLSNAEFIEKDNGSIGINPQIEIKIIDIGIKEIIEIGAKNKLKQFEYVHNKKYLSENEQYILPNNHMFDNPQINDIWAYGMVAFFCFFGEFPYTKIPNINDLDNYGFYGLFNSKLQQYLSMQNLVKFITPKILSLLSGILQRDPSKRFDINNILQHEWFKTLYKTYQPLSVNN